MGAADVGSGVVALPELAGGHGAHAGTCGASAGAAGLHPRCAHCSWGVGSGVRYPGAAPHLASLLLAWGGAGGRCVCGVLLVREGKKRRWRARKRICVAQDV